MKTRRFLILLSVAVLFASGCTEVDTLQNTGVLRITVTDAPFPFEMVEKANVVITGIDIRDRDTIGGNPFITLSEFPHKFDLISLRNGVTEELLEAEVPAGLYDLVRIKIGQASITVDGFDHELKVPGGAQTGIKVFIDDPVRVEGGLTTELMLDFNLEKSFVFRGNINNPGNKFKFNFKPVIRAVNRSTSGTIQGTVTDTSGLELELARVWMTAADTVFAAAYTDSTGGYAIPGIPGGIYPVFSTLDGYDTVSISDVAVLPANKTVVDFVLTPLK